jgi:lipopolysaccharide export system protein LptA
VRAVLGSLALLAAAAARPDAGPRHNTDGGSRVALRRPVRIDAERMEIRNAQKEASYFGHVRVHRDSTLITCNQMKALYTETEEVTRIFCDGKVEAVDGEKRVRSDHADYDNEAGILVMTCEPLHADGGRDAGACFVEVWNGKTHARGTRATFWSGEDRLELDGKVHTEIEEKQLKDGGR